MSEGQCGSNPPPPLPCLPLAGWMLDSTQVESAERAFSVHGNVNLNLPKAALTTFFWGAMDAIWFDEHKIYI